MTEIRHFSSNTDAQTITEALKKDGALIIDNVVSQDFIAALRSETDPYMNHTSNGEDPFAGFNTTRT
ncbi:MAG: phytanoyl-CoA dioxygenase family protein, partial [Luminiphilus sp.]|nr:phytanoyl-CoA dioxygenase family protein [Luminiphilus sp.]